MPIYEFYCEECNTIFNFFSKAVNTEKRPDCPLCKRKLERQMSIFSCTGRAKEENGTDGMPPLDEGKLERAMQMLASEADKIDEDNPKQASKLMRKLSDMTGVELGPGMKEALKRMEAGEDPEKIEAEMGDILENEEPFLLPGAAGKTAKGKKPAPKRDETLYEL